MGVREIGPAAGDRVKRRQDAMAVCAEATSSELDEAIAAIAYPGTLLDLRSPETGLVMIRARIGGDGGPFNLGEATVTRAAVSLECGTIGHAYHLGRDKGRARAAAVLDALLQTDRADAVERSLEPVRARVHAGRAEDARRAAATRVNFFTLTRGED